MDRFGIRDQAQLEGDLNEIIDVIENHKEKRRSQKQLLAPELTDHQRQIGLRLLESADLIDEIEHDYTQLGYVVEQTPHQPSRRSAEVGRNALADPDGSGSSPGGWPDQGAAALVGDVCILIRCA